MSDLRGSAYVFDLSGGALCLDFANTVSDRNSGREIDHLERYSDLVAFAEQVGLVGEVSARALRKLAARHAESAAAVSDRALALREALYRLFADSAAGRTARGADLALLNAALSAAQANLQIRRSGDRFDWIWRADPAALDRMLGPVARSAAELLTSDRLPSVRECAAATCGWLFLDRSRNQSRRWCDMKVCGNRSKVRRHYLRSRQ